MSEPQGRGGAWTEEPGCGDEGRRRLQASRRRAGDTPGEPQGRGGAWTEEQRGSGENARRPVVLRPMTAADLDDVVELEHTVFGSEAWTRQMLAGELEQQPASRYYLVAEDEGQIAGYAGLLGAGWQGDVLTLAVATGRWGQGIGSALLEALLAEAARRGCTEVFLEVRTDNTRAQELYRRHDFSVVGVRRGYYQPSGADALVMRRSLTGRRDGGESR